MLYSRLNYQSNFTGSVLDASKYYLIAIILASTTFLFLLINFYCFIHRHIRIISSLVKL